MKNTITVLIIVGMLCMVNVAYGAREDMSLAYLQMLPDESVKTLADWCAQHPGEPVSTNQIIDVPNYVSCTEILLDNLKRVAENTPPITCEEANANGLYEKYFGKKLDC